MVTFFICGALFVSMLSVIALLAGAVMKLFGFEYQTVGSIVLFFIIGTVISYPLGLIAGALPKALLFLGKMSKQTAVLLYLVLDTAATAVGLSVVDHFMQSVSATDVAIVIVSCILALFGIDDIKRDQKRPGSREEKV